MQPLNTQNIFQDIYVVQALEKNLTNKTLSLFHIRKEGH